MLKKWYEKSELGFAIAWIVLYCVLMSVGDALSAVVGIEKSVTLAIGLLLSVALFWFLKRNGLARMYGFCRPKGSARTMLYYIPLAFMLSANLWYGVRWNLGVLETVLYILSMLCVGFLEEVIFRGLLFGAMRKENLKAAIIVSSVTFGIGHIINLVNGSGADLLPNLLQIVYATAAGFMFVMICYKTESILVCIAAHGVFNALSVFVNDARVTTEMHIFTCVFLTLITGSYALYIALAVKGEKQTERQ